MKRHVPARPASQGTWSSRGQCEELWERTFAVAATREAKSGRAFLGVRRGQPLAARRVGDGGDRSRGRRPRHLGGEVCGGAVGVGPCAVELLGQALGHTRVGRRQGDREASVADRERVVGTNVSQRRRDGRAHGARVVARPWVPPLLEMVATEGVAEAQVTWLVRSAVVPSV